jgi:16S rRNA (cytosine1402-N4)-methyltransferase
MEGLGQIITKKPVVPSDEEIENNIKARSAKMRIFKKETISR